ncbi:MAG: MBL fold metallo-hydrolase [Deltaproteobacteria bacterium]|nr:MBL fold metallo-hydrolase [Deltaproteobacteria bacterium]
MEQQPLDYNRAISIAEGTYWIGFYDAQSGLHCNPYLIVDGNEAVVIDAGSRPDFSTVMMKILEIGIDASSISALIYQHYDPDLCGSVAHFEDIIDRADLKIISDKENNMFIRHYAVSSRLVSIDSIDHVFQFSSGRKLQFFNTPYSHCAGSFVTYDTKTRVLFTSDLFGSYGDHWDLFLSLCPECLTCRDPETDMERCACDRAYCPIPDIFRFHRMIMTSEKALGYAMRIIQEIPVAVIAPQHGSILTDPRDIRFVAQSLALLKGVGIDRIV